MSGDRVIRFATAAVVCAVAAFAAVVSYSHIYGLGRAHGQDGTAARLLPLSVDGLILAASLVLLHEARNDRDWLCRSVLTPVVGESRIQLLINGRCFVSGSWIRLLGAGPSSEPRLWLSSVACQGRSATGSACGRSTLTRSSGRRIRHLRGRARCGCQPVESELADTGSP